MPSARASRSRRFTPAATPRHAASPRRRPAASSGRRPETANHELQEEAGYAAGRLDFLGELRPFSKYLTARSFVYLARALTPSHLQGDETYSIGVEQVPLGEFEALIAAGRLLDARVIAA